MMTNESPTNAPRQARQRPGRVVAIDYGMARIGIALSDERKILATALVTMRTERKAEATAEKLIQELSRHAEANSYRIEEIVVGMPLMMNGKHGMLADEVDHFITLLKSHIDIPIVCWDERLTSVQANRSLLEGNFSRKKRAKFVDAVAATIILQSYLDSLKAKNDRDEESHG
ncbi:MAG: Holliday junction resolvase RuvX [Parachlamydiaceae bacterium]